MEQFVEMEDGRMEFVVDTHWSDDCFRVHRWGDVWLVDVEHQHSDKEFDIQDEVVLIGVE